MRKILLGGLTAVLFLLSSPARSQEQIPGVELPPEAVEFLFFIADSLTRYELPATDRPHVVVVPEEWLEEKFCGGQSCNVEGAYVPAIGEIIFVRDGLPLIIAEQVVVHETIHWMQWKQAESELLGWSCQQRAAREAEAYAATYQYAVIYQATTAGFWMPPEYGCKPPEPQPFGVIAPPAITKGTP